MSYTVASDAAGLGLRGHLDKGRPEAQAHRLTRERVSPFLRVVHQENEAGSGQEGAQLRRRPGPSSTCRRCWATLLLCGSPSKLAKGE